MYYSVSSQQLAASLVLPLYRGKIWQQKTYIETTHASDCVHTFYFPNAQAHKFQSNSFALDF